MKKIIALLLATVMAFSLVACGSNALAADKINGTWTLSEMYQDDVALEGVEGSVVWTIDGKNLTVETAETTVSATIDVKSNGFEVIENGEIAFSVFYDEDNKTLSYKVAGDGVMYESFFTK